MLSSKHWVHLDSDGLSDLWAPAEHTGAQENPSSDQRALRLGVATDVLRPQASPRSAAVLCSSAERVGRRDGTCCLPNFYYF
jgi:hypothetical protein